MTDGIIERADSRQAVSSQSGGRCHRTFSPIWEQLLFTVMLFHIDFLATNHSEVTSDKNMSIIGIFANFAKALTKVEFNMDIHNTNVIDKRRFGNLERLVEIHRPLI